MLGSWAGFAARAMCCHSCVVPVGFLKPALTVYTRYSQTSGSRLSHVQED